MSAKVLQIKILMARAKPAALDLFRLWRKRTVVVQVMGKA